MNPALWAADYCSQQSSYYTTQDDRMDEPETGGFCETSYWQNCISVDGYTNFVSTIPIGNCILLNGSTKFVSTVQIGSCL